jgi:DNA-binding transcriptional ArsR family regulator
VTAPFSADRLVPVFQALGDGTRWRILTRLGSGELSASGLAAELPVSRQAIAKHLLALADAGLVQPVRDGREIRYRALGARLTALADDLDRLGSQWDKRLDRLRSVSEARESQGAREAQGTRDAQEYGLPAHRGAPLPSA